MLPSPRGSARGRAAGRLARMVALTAALTLPAAGIAAATVASASSAARTPAATARYLAATARTPAATARYPAATAARRPAVTAARATGGRPLVATIAGAAAFGGGAAPIPAVAGAPVVHLQDPTPVSTAMCLQTIRLRCYSPVQYRVAYDLNPL
jgi:hypothetical protein